jgi:endonuclease/exonuclease/phosphatase family metal-dependent hydrolase
MIKIIILMLSLFSVMSENNFYESDSNQEITIMTYNMEYGGNNRRAIEKNATPETYAEIIKASKADIVNFQEAIVFEEKDNKYTILRNTTEEIAKVLGWNFIIQKYDNDYATSIITRFPVTKLYKTDDMYNAIQKNITIAAKLLVNNQEILVINDHLRDEPYQPQIMDENPKVDNPEEFVKEQIKSAYNTRTKQLFEGIIDFIFLEENINIPTFLTGDFNEPSHLDWTEDAFKNGKCPYTVKWPCSSALTEIGFKDAYRTFRPNLINYPGISWSMKLPEDQGQRFDRIDYIYYKNIEVIDANMFDPGLSDHASFIAKFRLK